MYTPAEKWLRSIYAYVESQLSESLFQTESDLKKQLPPDLVIKKTSIFETQKYGIRRYKTTYFDSQKEGAYRKVVEATDMRGIAIWKPIWEYLILQVPDAYTFRSKSLDLSIKQDAIVHLENEDYFFDKYLSGVVPVPQKVPLMTQFVAWICFFAPIIILMAITVYKKWFGFELIGIGLGLGLFLYMKDKFLVKCLFISRKDILNALFPNRRIISDNIGEYYAEKAKLQRVEINLSRDETVTCNLHLKFLKKDLEPSYLQKAKAISIFRKSPNDKFRRILKKKEDLEPILFFEEGEVVIIPFETIDAHPIIRYMMRHIKLEQLDGPAIINDYLIEKLDLKSQNPIEKSLFSPIDSDENSDEPQKFNPD